MTVQNRVTQYITEQLSSDILQTTIIADMLSNGGEGEHDSQSMRNSKNSRWSQSDGGTVSSLRIGGTGEFLPGMKEWSLSEGVMDGEIGDNKHNWKVWNGVKTKKDLPVVVTTVKLS